MVFANTIINIKMQWFKIVALGSSEILRQPLFGIIRTNEIKKIEPVSDFWLMALLCSNRSIISLNEISINRYQALYFQIS
jgi:hypothetical protein